MSSSLTYRTLTRRDMAQMYQSFIEAFAQYQVSMKMSREAFEDRMLSKVNIQFELSPGVFSGDKLVAFIFQTINNYEGVLAAYNGGTGVIPGYLGQGLTTKMYDFINPKLIDHGVDKCVLEVLVDNEAAITAYRNAGFKESKTFQCLMLKDGVLKRNPNQIQNIVEAKVLSEESYGSIGDVAPSMLDQLVQIQYHLEKETILEYRKEREVLGYLIFQQGNGRIAQLAVKKDHRNQGIGTALIAKAHALSESKALSILNIEVQHEGVIRFFEKLGFIRDLQQYEMQKRLTNV